MSQGCYLCGLDAKDLPVRGEGDLSRRLYCCRGCAAVDEILESLPAHARASAAAALAEKLGARPDALLALENAAHDEGRDAQEKSSGAAEPWTPEGALVEERFRVAGLHCPSCAWLVEHTLSQSPGVTAVSVDFLTEVATAKIDLTKTSRQAALSRLDDYGYRAEPLTLGAAHRKDPERLVLRLGVAAMVAMNTMMLAWAHYAEVVGAQSGQWKPLIGLLGAAFALPAVTYSAAPIFRRAVGLARVRRIGMESLLALGIIASVALSVLAFVVPGGSFYFEIPPMIVATALGSRLIEGAIRRSGAKKVAEFLAPRALRVQLDGSPGRGFAHVDDLKNGDRILVPPGSEVPADVAVHEGAEQRPSGRGGSPGAGVSVSEAVLTGEPAPVRKRPGATVLAGSVVVQGTLHGEVLRPASESAHAQVGRQVLSVLSGGSEQRRGADRVASGFVLVILGLATLTVAGHGLLGGGFGVASTWLPAIAVLVVACPCAFSIAASAAFGAAVLRLVHDGLLVRDVAALEKMAEIDTVVFDKTGTLTAGDMNVTEEHWRGQRDTKLLATVLALESRSRHPMAAAVCRHLREKGIEPAEGIHDASEILGQGMQGHVDGRAVFVGAPALFATFEQEEDELSPRSVVAFGAQDEPAGAFLLEDPLRPQARDTVEKLLAQGVSVMLLSGDSDAVVADVARQLSIEHWQGRATPEGKAARIKELVAQGSGVAYVGDGVNDAPALAAATIGIAMRHGAGLAVQTAELLSVLDEPSAAVTAIEQGKRLRAVTIQNYIWAIGYNALLVPVAALGWLHPAWAALSMLLSSVTVLANSARLLRSTQG